MYTSILPGSDVVVLDGGAVKRPWRPVAQRNVPPSSREGSKLSPQAEQRVADNRMVTSYPRSADGSRAWCLTENAWLGATVHPVEKAETSGCAPHKSVLDADRQ